MEPILNIAISKLKENITESDIMNYYETSIILEKPLDEFNEKYRKLIVSEKYLIILTVLDILRRLIVKFNAEEKAKAIADIKKINIEAKDKDLIKWDFSDILPFIDKKKENDLSAFARLHINYLEREIKLEELQ